LRITKIIPSKPETRVVVVLIGLTLITIISNGIASVDQYDRDIGTWSYIGKAILEGQVPYRDVWDHKAPGLYYIYALIFSVLTPSLLGLKIGEIIAVLLAAPLIYWLSRKFGFRRIPAALTMLIYSLFISVANSEVGGLTDETYVHHPILIGYILLGSLIICNPRRSVNFLSIAFAAGFAFAVAFLIRQTAILHVIVAVIVLAMLYLSSRSSRERRMGIGSMMALFTGFAIPVGVTFFYFWRNGALSDLIDQAFLFNVNYLNVRESIPEMLIRFHGELLRGFSEFTVLWLLSAIGIALAVISRRNWLRGGEALIVLMFLADVLSWAVSLRFRFVDMALLVPSLALLTGYALSKLEIETWWKEIRRRRAVDRRMEIGSGVTIALALFLLILTIVPLSNVWLDGARSARRAAIYGIETPRGAAEDILAVIDSNVDPGDQVYLWGYRSGYYFLEDRTSPTRYIYNYPLVGRFGGVLAQDWVSAPDIDKFIEDLDKSRPKLIVTDLYSYHGTDASYLDEFIAQNYQFLTFLPPETSVYILESP